MGKDTVISPAEFQILLALVDGPKHGRDIRVDVRERTDGAVDMGPGTLYGAIKRLTRRGWIDDVTAKVEDLQDERLRYYAATPAGLGAAREEALRLSALLGIARAKRLIG